MPYLLFNACVSVFLVSQLCGRHSGLLEALGLIAGGSIPATIVHLATAFPRERGIAQRAPQMIGMVYGANAVLVLVSSVNFHRSPAVWVLADRVLNALAVAAWGVLFIQCILAVRESDSILERTRARFLLWGTVGFLAGAGIGFLLASGSMRLLAGFFPAYSLALAPWSPLLATTLALGTGIVFGVTISVWGTDFKDRPVDARELRVGLETDVVDVHGGIAAGR